MCFSFNLFLTTDIDTPKKGFTKLSVVKCHSLSTISKKKIIESLQQVLRASRVPISMPFDFICH